MKALYCGGCGDLIGLPQDPEAPAIRQCHCGRVRARWATNKPHVGQCLFHETLDPIGRNDFELLQKLIRERAQTHRTGGAGITTDELDELLDPSWHDQWDALMLRLDYPIASDLCANADAAKKGSLRAWLVGIHNAVLNGAHTRDWGVRPSFLDYRAWQTADGSGFKTYETMVIRVRPGESSDSKLVPFTHLLNGRWEYTS